jgi:hypothetical protein
MKIENKQEIEKLILEDLSFLGALLIGKLETEEHEEKRIRILKLMGLNENSSSND